MQILGQAKYHTHFENYQGHRSERTARRTEEGPRDTSSWPKVLTFVYKSCCMLKKTRHLSTNSQISARRPATVSEVFVVFLCPPIQVP